MSVEFLKRNNKIVLSKCDSDFLPYINEILTKVNEIDFGALMYNYELESVLIPSNIKTVSRYAFKDCYNLSKVVISNGVVNINDYAFCECNNLQSVTLPTTLQTLGDGVFYGCSKLESIVLPDSLTTIGDRCFEMCDNLRQVTISPNSKLDKASLEKYKNLIVMVHKNNNLLSQIIQSNNEKQY